MKKFITIVAALLLALFASAQEVQFQYDFMRSHKDVYSNTEFAEPKTQLTATLTGTHFDKWGSTFYFVDFDFAAPENSNKCVYGEVQRSLNFWSNTDLKDLSVKLEYNGGMLQGGGIGISQAFLTGIGYAFHDATFRNFFEVQVLYRTFFGNGHEFGSLYVEEEIADIVDISNPENKETESRRVRYQKIPLQFTAVYTFKDLFNIKGLTFMGFADFWWQRQVFLTGEETPVVFSAEPQLWYNIGQHFGVNNFHIGGEVEVSYNAYSMIKHFTAYPAAGVRWTF